MPLWHSAAATYPLELMEADRFVKDKKGVEERHADCRSRQKGWDDSVKALTATPSVLDMMSDKLGWAKSLGDAMLAQRPSTTAPDRLANNTRQLTSAARISS